MIKRNNRALDVVAPQLLSEEFSRPPLMRTDRERKARVRLSRLEKRFIHWAAAEDYTADRTALALGCDRMSVYRFMRKSWADAGQFLESRFVVWVYRAPNRQDRVWYCRYCGEAGKASGSMANHAYRHVFDFDAANSSGKMVRAQL